MKALLVAASLALCIAGASSARAADAEKLARYDGWTAYSFKEDGKIVCFMAASPDTAEGKYNKRGSVYAMVTHRPGDDSIGVFSYLSGYDYAAGQKVTVTIDGTAMGLIGTGEMAWTPDDASDKKLLAALRRGSKMVVEGTSSRGTATKDTFSLKGSGAAYKRISQECDVSS